MAFCACFQARQGDGAELRLKPNIEVSTAVSALPSRYNVMEALDIAARMASNADVALSDEQLVEYLKRAIQAVKLDKEVTNE